MPTLSSTRLRGKAPDRLSSSILPRRPDRPTRTTGGGDPHHLYGQTRRRGDNLAAPVTAAIRATGRACRPDRPGPVSDLVGAVGPDWCGLDPPVELCRPSPGGVRGSAAPTPSAQRPHLGPIPNRLGSVTNRLEERRDFGVRQSSGTAGAQVAQPDRSDRGPDEPGDRMSHLVEQPSHDVLPPLVQG
jgi:hypothetical protein